MPVPSRSKLSNDYRYGFNGMETDPEAKGAWGNSYTTEFRQYDSRLARWTSLDPLMKKYPSLSPYVAFNNNPLYFADPTGLEGDSVLVIGTTYAKITALTDEEIKTELKKIDANTSTGLSIEFITELAKEEALSLKMYDVDNNEKVLKTPKGRGGNATIGFGHLIHLGAIGSTQYDSEAKTKEKEYKDGITKEEAFKLLIADLKPRIKSVKYWFRKIKKEPSEGVMSVVTDIYFNSGTRTTKKAIKIYDNGGALGLYMALQKKKLNSPSNKRRKMRMRFLEKEAQKQRKKENPPLKLKRRDVKNLKI